MAATFVSRDRPVTETAPASEPKKTAKAPRLLPIPGFRAAGNPSLPTFVALMLIVTTFMIVLASISIHDASKMKDLLGSMRETFGKTNPSLSVDPPEATSREILAEGAAGFRAAVPATLPSAASGGSTLVLTLPMNAVIDAGADNVRGDFATGLRAVSDALARRPAETLYRVELRFGRDGDSVLPETRPHYAAMLAAATEKAGFDSGAITLGSGPGPADQFSLRVDLLAAAPPQEIAPGTTGTTP